MPTPDKPKGFLRHRTRAEHCGGTGYDTNTGTGHELWMQVAERLERQRALHINDGPAAAAATEGARYGSPQIVMPRLGQGAFRVLVTDAYSRPKRKDRREDPPGA